MKMENNTAELVNGKRADKIVSLTEVVDNVSLGGIKNEDVFPVSSRIDVLERLGFTPTSGLGSCHARPEAGRKFLMHYTGHPESETFVHTKGIGVFVLTQLVGESSEIVIDSGTVDEMGSSSYERSYDAMGNKYGIWSIHCQESKES